MQQSVVRNSYDSAVLTFEVIKIDDGWGYEIYKDDTIFIKQELIPAVNGYFLFKTPVDASKAALLVVEKMSQKAGLPSLTIDELDSIGVLDSTILNYQKLDLGTKNPDARKYIRENY
ncbi:MAG: DUF4907 domain-containing protein [Bacteroidota bacterium]|nr:DUF4907 domain-containing protein [Bacteroidota bacterium]